MSQKIWSTVDSYIAENLLPADTVLEAALRSNRSRGLPEIDVSPTQGKLLYLLARMNNARRILEIGTLGGYSTIWLARALPADGKVVTLELEQHHADVAWINFKMAGLSERIDLRVGPALKSLEEIGKEHAGPFDLVFIDADKEGYPAYAEWAARNLRVGGVVLGDNAFLFGQVADDPATNARIGPMRTFHQILTRGGRFRSTMIPTGEGLALGVKIS